MINMFTINACVDCVHECMLIDLTIVISYTNGTIKNKASQRHFRLYTSYACISYFQLENVVAKIVRKTMYVVPVSILLGQ